MKDGEIEKVQSRLVLMNLEEAFLEFKEKKSEDKIGISKYASLRPKECVLAGSTHGMHTTCVCIYHQNVKLIFDSLKSQYDLRSENVEGYRDLMAKMMCHEPTEKC